MNELNPESNFQIAYDTTLKMKKDMDDLNKNIGILYKNTASLININERTNSNVLHIVAELNKIFKQTQKVSDSLYYELETIESMSIRNDGNLQKDK